MNDWENWRLKRGMSLKWKWNFWSTYARYIRCSLTRQQLYGWRHHTVGYYSALITEKKRSYKSLSRTLLLNSCFGGDKTFFNFRLETIFYSFIVFRHPLFKSAMRKYFRIGLNYQHNVYYKTFRATESSLSYLDDYLIATNWRILAHFTESC